MNQSGEITQEALDSTQYSTASIRQYESVFGEDFVSPGGYEMAVELIGKMKLERGSRVLDVGCGLGGSAFVMAREFGLIVDGIDLSKNMLALAGEKLSGYQLAECVKFEQGDCLEMDRSEYYDAIYSRDVFLHITDKSRLFSVLNSLLKPGGKLLFTDYCCGEKRWTDEFSEYVKDRDYFLHTFPEYVKLISRAGLTQVDHQDLTDRFIVILQTELSKISGLDLAEPIRLKLAQSWRGKLDRAGSGDHRWGLFTAIKAS